MANPEHVDIVEQGAKAIAKWRKQHPRDCLDLIGAELFGGKMGGIDLVGADLSRADLSVAKIYETDLTRASLRQADLSAANIIGADLTKADLSGAMLYGTHFFAVDLIKADLTAAHCYETVFADCNLHQARGLETVVHEDASSIGIDTVITSFRATGNKLMPELETFFRGAGVPSELLSVLPGILKKVRYCTCFISYGEPDKEFAERLRNDLVSKGTSCWFYRKDAIPGPPVWKLIKEKLKEFDKMLLVCSAESLTQAGVLKEIEEQVDEDWEKIVPVCLDNVWRKDNFLIERAGRDLKPFIIERTHADFSSTIPYDEALEKLLKGLEIKQVKRKKQRKQS